MIDNELFGDGGDRETGRRGDGENFPPSPSLPVPPSSPPSPSSPPPPAWQRPFDWSGDSQIEILLEGERPSPPLLEEEEIDEFAVSSASFANPSAKVAFVAGGAVLAVLVLWLILSGTFTTPKAGSERLAATEEKNSQPEALAAPPDGSVGKLKTELALSQQEQQLARLKQQKPNQKPSPKGQKPPQPTQRKSPPPQPVRAALPPPPPRPAAPPRRRPPPPPARREPTVLPVTRPAPPPPPPPPPPAATAPAPDPQAAWLAAAQIGSYGGVDEMGRRGDGETGRISLPPPVSQSPSPPVPPSTNIPPEERPVLLEGQGPDNRTRLPIGQSFRARLVDSLFWDGTRTQMRGLAELLEPIASRDGEELAPAGSLVVVNLAHPSAAGVVKLAAEAIVVLGSEEDIEIPLPPNALLVRGPDGMPLMAQRLERGGSPEVEEGINWGGLLFDVARTGAEFGLGGSGSNAYRDIYRYQQLESLYNRHFGQPPASPYPRPLPRQSSTTWLLPAGLEVQLYVNQSFEFGIRNELRGPSAAEFGIENWEGTPALLPSGGNY